MAGPFEWRIQDIERKANDAATKMEIASLRGELDRVERTVRELRSVVDGLRAELVSAQEALGRLAHLGEQP